MTHLPPSSPWMLELATLGTLRLPTRPSGLKLTYNPTYDPGPTRITVMGTSVGICLTQPMGSGMQEQLLLVQTASVTPVGVTSSTATVLRTGPINGDFVSGAANMLGLPSGTCALHVVGQSQQDVVQDLDALLEAPEAQLVGWVDRMESGPHTGWVWVHATDDSRLIHQFTPPGFQMPSPLSSIAISSGSVGVPLHQVILQHVQVGWTRWVGGCSITEVLTP